MMESVIVAIIVKATLVLLAAFGVTALMRSASAAARHAVWTAALVGVIAVPALTMVLPWRMDVLPAEWGGRPSAASPVVAGDLADTPMLTPTPMDWKVDVAREDGPTNAGTAATTGIGPTDGRTSPGTLTRLAGDPWRLAAFAWLAIAGLILFRIFAGMAWMWRLARRAEPLSGPQWLLPLGRVTQRLDLRTAVRVVRSDAAAMPVTCGVLRPAVVLPEESDAWTEERREAVLLHELAHVRRGDLATHLVAWLACALYWFHPLAWIAARRLRHESERACDDLVLGAGTRASEYATHLLDIVRSAGRSNAPAAAVPMAQRSSFEGRLLAILEPGVARHAMTARRKTALAAGLALVVLPLAAMAPAEIPDRGTPEDAWDSTALPADGIASDLRVEEKDAIETADPEAFAEAIAGGMGDGLVAVDGIVPSLYRSSVSTSDSESESQSESQSESNSQGQPKTKEQVEAEGRMIVALAAALDDPDAAVRMSSAQALGSLSDPRAVEALLEALRTDSDAGVRKMAAWALGEIESSAAVGGLSQAARSDASVDVRAMAVWALGEIESPEAVPALGAALRDSSVEVRRMAVWALGEIESAEAVEWLTPALDDGDVEIRRKAAWALGEIESAEAVPALGGALSDSDAEVRATATWALGEIQSPSAVDAIAGVIGDSDVEVRRKAVWALGEIQDPRGVAPLTRALSDEDKETRKTAVWALGEIQDPSAIPALRRLLDDPDAEIRETAIWALLEMDDSSVYDVLVQLLKDEDPEVRRKAAEALGDM